MYSTMYLFDSLSPSPLLVFSLFANPTPLPAFLPKGVGGGVRGCAVIVNGTGIFFYPHCKVMFEKLKGTRSNKLNKNV